VTGLFLAAISAIRVPDSGRLPPVRAACPCPPAVPAVAPLAVAARGHLCSYATALRARRHGASADARRSACDSLPLRLGFDFGSRGYSDTPYAVGPEGCDPNLQEAPLYA
jgi:hypothetical protein